jgi:hypothetical protein
MRAIRSNSYDVKSAAPYDGNSAGNNSSLLHRSSREDSDANDSNDHAQDTDTEQDPIKGRSTRSTGSFDS